MAMTVTFTFDPLTVRQLQELAVSHNVKKSKLLRDMIRQAHAELQATQAQQPDNGKSTQPAATAG